MTPMGFFYENGAFYGEKYDGEKSSESLVDVRFLFRKNNGTEKHDQKE